MARIFITGSADGLGQLAAKALIALGHSVVLHARSGDRARDTRRKVPRAENVLVADLSDIEETKRLAGDVNASGPFDVVIHNAGVYQVSPDLIFHVNTLAPYILTCLIHPPKRLIYLSSGMHLSGRPNLEMFRSGATKITYSDSKLHVVMLAKAAARRWPDTYSNAVDPGWVPTKMGGRGAPDDLEKGYDTQVWLATSNDEAACVSGNYFYHRKTRPHNPVANDVALQNHFLRRCGELTNIDWE